MTTVDLDPAEESFADDEALWDDAAARMGLLDPIDLVTDVSAMMAMFAAERFERVEAMHRGALRDLTVFRGAQLEVIERSLRLELAAALQMTERAADRLLITAEGLVARYPEMLESLRCARTTERHAEVLVDLLDTVEPHLRDAIIPVAVGLAEEQPLGTFRRMLRSLIETTRATTLEQRHREAVSARRVVVEPADDGMAWLLVHLPAVEARAAHHRITAMAAALADRDGEQRSLDQLRSDVVADLLIDGVVTAYPEAVRGIRATVAVTVPVLSLLDDAHAARSEPPVVDGVGPIPLERARELCGSADGWMRILTHPETGAVLSVGRRLYRPPQALRRVIRWRAARCMSPGCGVPAARCQIDHRVAWSDGGRTELSNLNPLCQGHHTLKHHGGWVIRAGPGDEGAVEWISPLGRRYVVRPERAVPVFRAG